MSDADTRNVDQIDNDEVVYLRVPPYPPFHEPDDWLTTANFKLNRRENEQGLSVYRRRLRTLDQVLLDPSARPNSFVVSATVGEVRNLANLAGDPLHLDVVSDDQNGLNPGHAEIRGQVAGRLTYSASKALRDLFKNSGRLSLG